MTPDDFARTSLALLPTPLEEAHRMAAEIGTPRLFIKRDDTTGLAMGGNKARKLEYLMAEAQSIGAEVVITCGGVQSNHVRMTAAAARKLGMEAILVIPEPRPQAFNGNLLLDTIIGAELRFIPGLSFEGMRAELDRVADAVRRSGRVPYVVPVGGSTPLGALGYVNAVREIAAQLAEIGVAEADMVTALGSGGTLSGLALGCHLYSPGSRPIGISVVLPEPKMRPMVEGEIRGACSLMRLEDVPDMTRMRIFDAYIGKSYGVPTPEAIDAIYLAARTEGILLDPVYTGKAMAGLIDLVKKGEIGRERPVVFWHTGGAPALFAFEETFRSEANRLTGGA